MENLCKRFENLWYLVGNSRMEVLVRQMLKPEVIKVELDHYISSRTTTLPILDAKKVLLCV